MRSDPSKLSAFAFSAIDSMLVARAFMALETPLTEARASQIPSSICDQAIRRSMPCVRQSIALSRQTTTVLSPTGLHQSFVATCARSACYKMHDASQLSTYLVLSFYRHRGAELALVTR